MDIPRPFPGRTSSVRLPIVMFRGANRLSWRQVVLLMLIASAAWGWTVDNSLGMASMDGTAGSNFEGFIIMWLFMMTAMMLPSAAPFISLYSDMVNSNRLSRLFLFGSGYLLIWGLSGFPAFGLALGVDEIVQGKSFFGTVLATVIFFFCGVYQLTSIKYRCLDRCRSPLSQIYQAASFKGFLRDFRAGVHNGVFCLSCCWALMILMIAFGFMNLWAMIGLAIIIAIEKHWVRGETFGKSVGVLALCFAIAVIWIPEIAPGLTENHRMTEMLNP